MSFFSRAANLWDFRVVWRQELLVDFQGIICDLEGAVVYARYLHLFTAVGLDVIVHQEYWVAPELEKCCLRGHGCAQLPLHGHLKDVPARYAILAIEIAACLGLSVDLQTRKSLVSLDATHN